MMDMRDFHDCKFAVVHILGSTCQYLQRTRTQVSRGGCCGLVCDRRKAVACGKDDGRVVAVDLSSDRVLRSVPDAMQVAGKAWHTRQFSGPCCAMLWDSNLHRDTVLVGSSNGLVGAMRLPLVF